MTPAVSYYNCCRRRHHGKHDSSAADILESTLGATLYLGMSIVELSIANTLAFPHLVAGVFMKRSLQGFVKQSCAQTSSVTSERYLSAKLHPRRHLSSCMSCVTVAIRHTIGQPALVGGFIGQSAPSASTRFADSRSTVAWIFIAFPWYPTLRFYQSIGSIVMKAMAKICMKKLIGTRPNLAW